MRAPFFLAGLKADASGFWTWVHSCFVETRSLRRTIQIRLEESMHETNPWTGRINGIHAAVKEELDYESAVRTHRTQRQLDKQGKKYSAEVAQLRADMSELKELVLQLKDSIESKK